MAKTCMVDFSMTVPHAPRVDGDKPELLGGGGEGTETSF